MIQRLTRASWWLVIATCGLLGCGLAAQRVDQPWQGVDQLTSAVVGLSWFVLALVHVARPVEAAWWRGAVATTGLLVCLSWFVLLDGDTDTGHSVLQHLVTPVLVALDFVVVGRATGRRWWPLTWLVLPLAYLVRSVSSDLVPYEALDPYSPDYRTTVLGLAAATVVLGYLLLGLRRARVDGTRRP